MSKEFGNHLRKLRKECGCSQQQMADLLNISRSTYTYYETGKSEPSLNKIKVISKALKTDYNTIFDY